MRSTSDHLNLVNYVAWSYHRTTGLELEELIGEAMLAYAETLRSKKYDPERSGWSTWIYTNVKNHLNTYCQHMKKSSHITFLEHLDTYASNQADPEITTVFKNMIEKKTSEDVQKICRMIFEKPTEFTDTPKFVRGKLYRRLRALGWSWSRIWNSLREIKNILNENPA